MTAPSDEVRQRFIDAALELIDEVGVDEVRLHDVLARTGLSNGSLYWHFKNRRSLVDAALAERYARRLRATVDAAAAEVSARTSDALLDAHLAPLLDPFRDDLAEVRADRIAVLAGALADPRLAEQLRTTQSELLTELSSVIARQQAVGLVRTDVPAEAMAMMIQVIAVGLASLDLEADPERTAELWMQVAPIALAAFRS